MGLVIEGFAALPILTGTSISRRCLRALAWASSVFYAFAHVLAFVSADDYFLVAEGLVKGLRKLLGVKRLARQTPQVRLRQGGWSKGGFLLLQKGSSPFLPTSDLP